MAANSKKLAQKWFSMLNDRERDIANHVLVDVPVLSIPSGHIRHLPYKTPKILKDIRSSTSISHLNKTRQKNILKHLDKTLNMR